LIKQPIPSVKTGAPPLELVKIAEELTDPPAPPPPVIFVENTWRKSSAKIVSLPVENPPPPEPDPPVVMFCHAGSPEVATMSTWPDEPMGTPLRYAADEEIV
jgi:hypothetical protein